MAASVEISANDDQPGYRADDQASDTEDGGGQRATDVGVKQQRDDKTRGAACGANADQDSGLLRKFLDLHDHIQTRRLNGRLRRRAASFPARYSRREAFVRVAYAAIALVRFSATLSRKPVVDSQRWSAPNRAG